MDSTATPSKPSYLGLLNAIALGESAAAIHFEAWANVTPIPELACVLRFVAAREKSHGEVFCRRIAELGFTLRQTPDVGRAKRLAKWANPEISDLEKIGPERREADDPFADIRRRMAEGEFDPLTLLLMNWYIAEEKDSGKRLDEAYACVRQMAAAKQKPAALAEGPSADAKAIMACMTAGFARLEQTLAKSAGLARAAE
jgi:hypothetical protein